MSLVRGVLYRGSTVCSIIHGIHIDNVVSAVSSPETATRATVEVGVIVGGVLGGVLGSLAIIVIIVTILGIIIWRRKRRSVDFQDVGSTKRYRISFH